MKITTISISNCIECSIHNYSKWHSCHRNYPDCPLPDAPEWKDKPDSEGWWWFKSPGNRLTITHLTWLDGSQKYLSELHYETVDKLRGKWQKAVIPSLPEE